MKWPLREKPVPRSDVPLYNLYYLHASEPNPSDPTIVWGSDVEVDPLQAYLRNRNRQADVLFRPVHLLLQAVSLAIEKYPEFNRRVVGRRVYEYRDINLRLALHDQRAGGVGVLLLTKMNERSLQEIAQLVWSKSLEFTMGRNPEARDCRRLRRVPSWLFHILWNAYHWLDARFCLPTLGRLEELRSGAVFVNDLSFRGAPPMRFYKPSRFPDESSSVSVTLGPSEVKVVVHNGTPQVANVAPLIVRADHRLVDAFQVSQFVATIRDNLQHPAVMEELKEPSDHGVVEVRDERQEMRRAA